MKSTISMLAAALFWLSPAFAETARREQIETLLAAGQVDAASDALTQSANDPALALLRLRVLLLRQDYAQAMPLADALLALPAPNPAERALIYAWLFARDDLAQVDKRSSAMLDTAAAGAVDALAAGRLALERLDYPRAEARFRQALQLAQESQSEDKAAAQKGLGQVAYKRRDFDGSLTWLNDSVATHASADGLLALAETLIRLGRTDEAIAAVERAIRLNPYHELGHYYLGNGYARKNYTELAAHYGGRLDEATTTIRRASTAFDAGDYRGARDLAIAALRLCPEYGRAHAVLAKALELERFGIDVHRAHYERRFAAMAMPEVPGIEKYVANWADLSPRHRKRVALSLAPWRAFIPVLLAGGSTHYIKPLYMKLSDVPNMETMKDQRINYDSRLWDDVRGAGGFTTVTGIEDVERTIFDRYNTVLHETTHQVHGVLTADQAREIQELYRQAKERDDATHDAFLSRYAGGSVWEYFAEGANALESPQRDAYDAREVVRERLTRMDPALQALVKRLFAVSDVRANLPVSYVNAGNNQLEKGQAAPAMAYFKRALKTAPKDETVWIATLYGLGVLGDRQGGLRAAARAVKLHPASGGIQTGAAEALWRGGRPLAEAVAKLAASRDAVKEADRYLVDLALGGHYWRLGDAPRALSAYEKVLAYQSDNPEALWGKAAAQALAERWDEAFASYGQAVRLRTGVVELRADFARDLLRAGRSEAAKAQLDAARLLDPIHPTILALDGWLALENKDADGALAKSAAALKLGPWSDLARLISAAALQALGRQDEAKAIVAPLRERLRSHSPPELVYRVESATWLSVHELPVLEQRMLAKLP